MKNSFGTFLLLICFSGFIASPTYAEGAKKPAPRGLKKNAEKIQIEQEVGQKLAVLADRVRVLEQQASRPASPLDLPATPPYSYP